MVMFMQKAAVRVLVLELDFAYRNSYPCTNTVIVRNLLEISLLF